MEENIKEGVGGNKGNGTKPYHILVQHTLFTKIRPSELTILDNNLKAHKS